MTEVALSEVCEIIAGQSPPSSSYNQSGKGIPFFQGKADFGDLYPTVRYWCTEPKKMSAPGDILFSVRAPVGPTNINQIEASVGRGLAAIRCGRNIDQKYLLHYLRANEEKIAALGTGSTFSAITIGTLKDIKIPLPPLATQKKIAAILDAADAHRQKTKQLLAKYDELAQSIFLDMFGDPVTNPKGWEVKKLNEVCRKILGGGTPSKSKEEYFNGEIPWVTPKDMKVDFLSSSIDRITEKALLESSAKLIPENSLLMVIRSGILKKKLPLAINQCEVALNQDMKAFIPTKRLTIEYFFYLMKSFESFLLTKVRAVTADNIEFRQIKELVLPVPDLKSQQDFSLALQNIKQSKALIQKEYKESENLFNSLLQKAFKGELVN